MLLHSQLYFPHYIASPITEGNLKYHMLKIQGEAKMHIFFYVQIFLILLRITIILYASIFSNEKLKRQYQMLKFSDF